MRLIVKRGGKAGCILFVQEACKFTDKTKECAVKAVSKPGKV